MNDNVIVSIKLRLAEIDLEIFDARKRLLEAESLGGQSCYATGFEQGILINLCNERVILNRIMRGNYKND